ncbi:unnamed protein product [Calypogeia fissa]
METTVGSFAIAGATLAQMMHDFGTVEGDCDGLLFGRLQHQTTSNMQDDSAGPAVTHEQITARVTGYYCSGRVQSFYDATGRLNHSKLSNIVKERQSRGEDPPIGWYLGRRNSTLWPSMREVAVTTYLRSGIIAPLVAEQENAANVTTPAKSNVGQLSSSLGSEPSSTSLSGTRRSSSLTPIDNNPQTGRLVGLGGAAAAVKSALPTLEIPGSPTMSSSPRRSSNSASPRPETRVEPVVESTTPISPCFFVLFTESESINKSVRTHEYRAFQSLKIPKGISFEPLPVNIVNAGVLRGFYDSFVPVASIPTWFNSNLDLDTTAVGSSTEPQSGGDRSSLGESAVLLDNNGGKSSRSVYEEELASLDVQESVDSKGGSRVIQFESMYQQMLTRLEKLSVEAYESSATLQ